MKIVIALAIALLAGTTFADKPTKMSQAQGDALYRILDKLTKLIAERDAIYKALEIDPAQVGKSVVFSTDTLEIARAPEPAKQKAAGGK